MMMVIMVMAGMIVRMNDDGVVLHTRNVWLKYFC